jgi:predicted nucleic acid-binding protein
VRARRVRAVAPLPAGLRYIETSALLAALLEGDADARAAVGAGGRRVTSALTFAEAARAIVRARTAGRLTADQERAALGLLLAFERRFDVVAVTDEVLTRAGRPFPAEPIRTLDAIHLATVEILRETPQFVTIVTRDMRVRENARALGYGVG